MLGSSGTSTTVVVVVVVVVPPAAPPGVTVEELLPFGFGFTTMVCGAELVSVVLRVVVVEETRFSRRNVSLLEGLVFVEALLGVVFEGFDGFWGPD